MVYSIEEIKEKTEKIARQYDVGKMSLFGSYARGEATENSDVDFLIERGAIQDLFCYFAFVEDLENALGCHVDVVMDSVQDQDFVKKIRTEGIMLYESQR